MEVKNMILWTTGIIVDYGYAGNNKFGWTAKCNWEGGAPTQDGYMQGEIRTTYFEPTLEQAINEVLAMMTRFMIKPCNEVLDISMDFSLYTNLYTNPKDEYAEYIKEAVSLEAKRRGWKCFFN